MDIKGLSDSSDDANNSDSQDGAGPSSSTAAAASTSSSSSSSSPPHSSQSQASTTVTSADGEDSTGFEPQATGSGTDPDAIHLSTGGSNQRGHRRSSSQADKNDSTSASASSEMDSSKSAQESGGKVETTETVKDVVSSKSEQLDSNGAISEGVGANSSAKVSRSVALCVF